MIYAYPMDQTGCGNYRVRWPGLQMIDRGNDITLIFPGEDGGLKANLDTNRRVKSVVIPEDCEAVLLQRPTNKVLVETIPFLQKEGIRVVVDIDDDLAAVSPRHPGWQVLHTRSDTGQSWDAVIQACKWADMVVASTPALVERYAPHGRGVVVRNRLPDHFFDAELQVEKSVHVGWAGGVMSHPDDLSVVGASLAQLACDVLIVGPVPIDMTTGEEDWKRSRRLLGTDRVTYTGAVEFDCWIPAISQIHVGMAPLEMTRFNYAKSYLKPLEYSAAKVPFVASGTPEYLLLGAGLIANRPKDWRVQLKRLLESEALREEEVARNYEIAQKNRLSLHVDEWESAWFG